jgi:putative endonuclease
MVLKWYVYLALCSDGTFYCGITTDPARREREHNSSKRGAKYTRSRRPILLKVLIVCDCKKSALLKEFHIKKMKHSFKKKLFENTSKEDFNLDS